MRIVGIRIRDFMGFDEIEARPGALTVIEGPNGSGKTSFLQAIVTALTSKGHDASVLRKGAEKSEVALELDTGQVAVLTTTSDKTTVGATEADGKKIAGTSARTFLSQLVDPLTVNPLALLNAPPKQRLAWLIETVPVAVSAEEITEATRFRYNPTGEERNGFDLLQRLRKGFYDDRTAINGQITSKARTVEELTRALPEGANAPLDLPGLRAQREELVVARMAAERDATRKRAEQEAHLATKKAAKISALREAAGDAIRLINEKLAADIAEANEKEKAYVNKLRSDSAAAVSAYKEQLAPQVAELDRMIGSAEEMDRAYRRAEDTRATIARYEAELVGLREQATHQTAAIAGIDGLKEKLIARVPIKGLEVREGDIWIDGVQFDRLNEESKIRLALKLARLRAGELPVACVDGLEALDSAHFAAFEKLAVKSGLQFFVTKVSDAPGLTVRTVESSQTSDQKGEGQ